MVASTFAIIYAPSLLAKSWPLLLSAAPVRVIQDIAGVTPLLFLNVWPLYRPITQAWLLELWLAFAVMYFAAGFLMLTPKYRHLENLQERRRMGALCLAVVLFGFILLHNFLTRSWTGWFGDAPPVLFSGAMFAAEAALFPLAPSTLAYCVLTESQHTAQAN
jgi:uncharacterized membrane protein